jgi:hypothetical protein
MEDLRDAIGGYAELSRELGDAHSECWQFFGQMLTWVNGSDWRDDSPKV